MLNIKIKKLHPNAVIPTYAKPGDAGMDLTAINSTVEGSRVTYSTGIAIEIPEGYVGLIFPRSSIYKTGLSLSNAVGVIDSEYRGEIKAIFHQTMNWCNPYAIGQRIMQLIILPYPQVQFTEVDELSTTERGEGGFGSSGK